MLEELWRSLWHSWIGRIGMGMLALFAFASIYVFLTFPDNFGDDVWNNPRYWADNPKAVPPVWVAWFDDSKAEHLTQEAREPAKQPTANGQQLFRYELPFSRNTATNPSFISFTVSDVVFEDIPPSVEVYLVEGEQEVFLWQHTFGGRFPGEQGTAVRYQDEPFRENITASAVVRERLEEFFASLRAGGQNEFTVVVEAQLARVSDSMGAVKIVVGGDVYGILGTDTVGRDIWQGILYGIPIALFIAIASALLMVSIGVVLGGISGYFGGVVDTLIQRFVDVIANVPLLPIMIFLIFVFGSRLIYVILILGFVGWTGLAISLRPLIRQVKTSGFVEALEARGYSNWRILFRHVLPQAFPYILANFIFALPTAILTEAGLSFLGLGDASVPTWGQMLQQGFNTGAQYLGYWWWIVPPGLAIIVTTVTFYLLFAAVEHLAEPRMKGGS